MHRLNATCRARPELREGDISAMYALYAAYYEATSYPAFRKDLADKQVVIELREEGILRGFSTLRLMEFELDGEPGRAIFSGDTIVEHRYWGEQALVAAFCRFAGTVKAAAPGTPLYWFLISKGYRTYRYLGAFSRLYYPNPHGPTPPREQRRLDLLGAMRFGDAYSARLGVVRFPSSQGHLRPQWAGVRDALRSRPEVRLFLERNPRFAEGEELCCLTELAAGNLRSHARRAFLEGLSNDAAFQEAVPLDRRSGDALSRLAEPGVGGPAARAADAAGA